MTAGSIRTPDHRLRVFISSTLGELADERQAARASVEQLRLAPVMFELGARPHPPRALYRSYLAQSDVFVGIYWQRYGWVAPDMEISGLEDEFVLSNGMPRLVYLKRPAPDMEPRLREMLSRLEDSGSVSYRSFTTADELHGLLLDDLAILLTERFEAGTEKPTSIARPHRHLPAQTSTFIGRDAELRDLAELLADDNVRLVTLTGAGGSGKTRLAIRAASDGVGHFADGVYFVDLSAEREPAEAFAAIARVVAVTVAGETRPVDALKEALQAREVLLVLDNFEQLMAAAVGVAELLESCARVTILITSREALRVRGEHVYPVPPLSLPDPHALAPDDSEAVQLFIDRAAAVQPEFRFGAHNADAVIAICRLLDGLPLAIELAAARIRLFDVDDLRARLEDRLDVVTGGPRDAPKRQQTLRDAIHWSYDLLGDDERTMLCVLAAFTGARLSDVEETARRVPELAGIDVVAALGSLIDKSLVRTSPGWDGRPRLSMLRTIRAYATERLESVPELAAAVRHAHALHYSEVAARLQQPTFAARHEVLMPLSDELGNMRAAWTEWAERRDVGRLNDLLGPLWGFYDARGDYRSAIELGWKLLECLAATPDSPERRRDEFSVRMSVARTELALHGYTADADGMIRDALEREDTTGDDRARFPGLRSLGHVHMMRTDFDQTAAVAGEVMAIAENEQDPVLLAEAHILAGMSAGWLVDFPSALEHYDKAVAYADATRLGRVDFRVGPHPVVVANGVSGLTRWFVGLPTTASANMQRALDLAEELDHPYSMAYALHHAGLLDLWRDDRDVLATRAADLRAIAEAYDYPMWRALGLILGGAAMAGSREPDAALANFDEGFAMYRDLAAPPVFWPALLMIHAEALRVGGRPVEALAVIAEAEATLQEGDPVEADLLIVHGDLVLATAPSGRSAAEAMFERSVAISSPRGGRTAQLRALTRLVELRRGTPREDAARQALREVYDGLKEGFDLPHLIAARAALETSV